MYILRKMQMSFCKLKTMQVYVYLFIYSLFHYFFDTIFLICISPQTRLNHFYLKSSLGLTLGSVSSRAYQS